ncbi:MAG: PAS domain-containing protein, partial [Rubrivivax sp.]|nr:PAS domain-containing protein [Rubrivivax sp.]
QHHRLWGLDPETVTPSFEIFRAGLHPDDEARVLAELQGALDGKLTYDCIHRVRRPDGSVRHVRARGRVHHGPDGQPERMVGTVLDISERVAFEAQHRLNSFVLDALSDAVAVVDDSRRYRQVNAAWLDVNGRRRDDVVGRTVEEVYPNPVSAERMAAMATALQGGHPPPVRAPRPHPQMRDRTIETRYFPFRDPAVGWQGVAMVSRDVTDDEAVRRALAGSVDNLRLTLNTIGDAIFATDAANIDEPVLFANEQLMSLWGIPPEEAQPLTARTIMRHATPRFADPEAEARRVAEIVSTNHPAVDRLELRDGRVLVRRCEVRQREPRPVRVWAFHDITAEVSALRALSEAEARQRMLLSAFPGFIWVLDSDYRLVYLNPAAADVYRPYRPPPGVDARTLFTPAVFQRLEPSLKRALAGETLTIDWHRPSSSGRTPDDLLIKLVPGAGADGQRLIYAFGIDISALKRVQAELEAAKDEAERANRAKTQFLSGMSHELRTPLNAVIGFSQVLEQSAAATLSPRQLRQVGEIRKAGQHLLALINDLLDLARIESGRNDLVPVTVPLDELFDECLQLVQPLAVSHQRRLERPPPGAGAARADRMRLKQVLINLLSNAIKFNRDDGRVRLLWVDEGPRVRIEVHDDGPGIDPDDQARLFRPFERLAPSTGQTPVGTGIGLALSRQLVLQMAGDIGVHSTPGQGSCFWLVLPRPDA